MAPAAAEERVKISSEYVSPNSVERLLPVPPPVRPIEVMTVSLGSAYNALMNDKVWS